MNNASFSSSNRVSFLGLLTLLFIALKLTGYIDWPWPYVLSPMLINVIIVTLMELFF